MSRTARIQRSLLAVAASVAAIALTHAQAPSAMPVRFAEGLVHGFLVVRTLDGVAIADGDLNQVALGDRVTNHLVYRFYDGSIQDELSVFTQKREFRLVSHHLMQKGRSFPQPLDFSLDGATGHAVVNYTDDEGPQMAEDTLSLPPNIANGLLLTILKNARPAEFPLTLSYVAATPKPRMVKLIVTPAGEEPFAAGKQTRKASHYVIKVKIGGVAGVIAPVIGKSPVDRHVWMLGGEAPAFLKSEMPFYGDGPVWSLELTSPAWPAKLEAQRK